MIAVHLRRIFGSLRTSVVLMVALLILLLAGVLVPQESTVGGGAIAAAAARSPVASFLLVRLGLASLATSRLFAAIVGLFLVNLLVVLAMRTAPTLRRIRSHTPDRTIVDRWTSAEGAITVPLSARWSSTRPATVVRGFGYRPRRIDATALWAVRHRTAPLGFILFHASFVVFAAAGAMVWATRSVTMLRAAEGQSFERSYGEVVRHAPAGDPLPLRFTLRSLEPRFENGEATQIDAKLIIEGTRQNARVNHPAEWGRSSIIITDAGIAPQLWIQDGSGFTTDRVVVIAEHDRETRLAAGTYELTVRPQVTRTTFPARSALADVPVEVVVRQNGLTLFRGVLKPGQSARIGTSVLILEGVQYWAALRIVSERGGPLLIIGFMLAVAGLVWRMIAHRREIALTWDEREVRIAGAGEFFPLRFRDELSAIAAALGSET